ncbi:Retrovirus-related Pol polyprotein from transposon TNT 1-94 [Durusdinium trenchii]|uniref:Retrovirus-related Pol polyprotein from transposon TNT 1-94 n=1 Tax=Durusdinium trenchii TaxID=1381693 RepID=A0ABP0JHZ7_9DINO
MSILMSSLSTLAEGPSGCQSEIRPRMLSQPDHSPDSHQREAEGFGKRAARSSHSEPYTKVHGNATVQERPFHRTWSLHKRQLPMVMHPHPKPWSHSSCPGKKETAEGENVFHRVWLTDVGKRGRWNRHKKKEFYEKQDQEMQSKLPHDLKFCCTDTHYKYWTHLLEGGVKAGGQEKLDYGYRGPSSTKQHFYLGKFENVKHYQRILRTGYFDPVTKQLRELQLDDRDEFDNRLHDDMINHNEEELRWAKCGSFDLYRPKHTASMPQLGADFVNRAG